MIDLDIISMKCIEEAFCETFVSLEENGGGERRKASKKDNFSSTNLRNRRLNLSRS